MKLGFVVYSIFTIATSVVDVQGALRGETTPKSSRALKGDKDDSEEVAGAEEVAVEVAVGDPTQCRDIPVEVRADGSQTNFATLYAGIYAWGETSNVNTEKLCDSFIAAYSYLTDCSAIPGSHRKVAECSVIADAVGPSEDAFLLNLTYFANTVNGAMLFHFEQADPSCVCDQCPGLDPFPGIYRVDTNGPVCTCYCDIMSDNLSNTACTCRSPVISELVDVMNIAYKDDNFYVLDARQLTLDSDCITVSTKMTFDDTYICMGF
jgi:hypothetical protein